ncbi:MAG: aminotransferase DegT [Verrucomicrobia bacterium]|nr:aminotransferase DegT [Verrucomicrobiota bacterium]
MVPLPIRDQYLAFGRPDIGDDEIAAVSRVMRSGWIGMGPETVAFEEDLAKSVDAPHVVTVSSCTAAMSLCLRALGIGAGDEVICPSMTWCSTANAAMYQGARPVFCDIDPATFCATPAAIVAQVTPRTKAVMVVHFGGFAVDVDELRRALPAHIAIVEDAAHALGSCYPNGRPVGSSGNLVCFSFYANKNVSTGEGGAIAVFDPQIADHLRSLRQHALPVNAWKRFTHAQAVLLSPQITELGYKANYTDLQAALGRVQLRRQPKMAELRHKIAECYLQRLTVESTHLEPQAQLDSIRHARHLYTVRVKSSCRLKRDELLAALRLRNVGATIHYGPLHQMPLYGVEKTTRLPVTEALALEILTLPISASMSLADADYVCDHVLNLLV